MQIITTNGPQEIPDEAVVYRSRTFAAHPDFLGLRPDKTPALSAAVYRVTHLPTGWSVCIANQADATRIAMALSCIEGWGSLITVDGILAAWQAGKDSENDSTWTGFYLATRAIVATFRGRTVRGEG